MKTRTLLFSLILGLIFSLFPNQTAEAARQSPLCKSKNPAYKEVSERQFLVMKKNIHKYANKRYALRAQIINFTSYSGGQFIRAYWVGRGSDGVTFGTQGMIAGGIDAMDLDNSQNFDEFIEGDIVFAKVVIIPKSSAQPLAIPIFAICSIEFDQLLD